MPGLPASASTVTSPAAAGRPALPALVPSLVAAAVLLPLALAVSVVAALARHGSDVQVWTTRA